MGKKTVVVGMSGGVDSSVTALLLKEEGYNVIGLFMKNWEETDDEGVCNASKDFRDVEAVCETIGIPYYSVNFVNEYRESVFAEFLSEIRKGRTPNPDILCNREIKFRVFFEKALQLGADFLATGHYCRTDGKGGLFKGVDPEKDQSYFLCSVRKPVLEKVLFPIGGFPKRQVRDMARAGGLPTAEKKDSTGICFIGKRDFRQFLSRYIPYQKGPFLTPEGKQVGEHEGMAYYTIGQRKGLGIGGPGDAWFVVDKDPILNIVYVEQGQTHPLLYSDSLVAEEIITVDPDTPFTTPFSCKAKIRYRQPEEECLVTPTGRGTARVDFLRPQRAVTLGQSVVFYLEDQCLGGGIIRSKEHRDQSKAF